MLRILLGFRTGNRLSEDPAEVLYCGHDADALNRAIASASGKLKLYQGLVTELRKARRPVDAETSQSESIPRVVVPTLKEVIAAGYSEEIAPKIVARQQRLFDAVAANPEITDEELAKLEAEADNDEKESLSDLTVAQLKERCEEIGIDTSGFRLKQEYIDAIELDDRLSELTIAELRAKCIALEIDSTGFRLKRQYLDALEAHQREAAGDDDEPRL